MLASGLIGATGEAAGGTMRLLAGQAATITLHQYDRDLKLQFTATHPAEKTTSVDLTETGPERIVVIGTGGEIRLTVAAVEKRAQPSRFLLTSEEPRAANARDALVEAAQRDATAAKQMLDPGDHAALERGELLFENARKAWSEAGDKPAAAAATVQLGTIAFYRGRQQQAAARFDEALGRLQGEGTEWIRAECLNNLGTALWQLGEFPRAITVFADARRGFAAIGHRRGESAALNNLAILYGEIGSYQEARNHYQAALEIARRLGEPGAEAFIRNNLGAVYHALGDDTRALATLSAARRLFLSSGQTRAAGRNWLRVAEIQFRRGAMEAAGASLREAIRLATKANDTRTLADADLLEGRAQARRGDLDKAGESFARAFAGYEALNSPAGRAAVLHQQGLAAAAGKRHAEAVRLLEQTLQIRRRLAMHDLAGDTLYELARAEQASSRLAAARERINEALLEVEQVRANSASPRDRMTYLAARHKYYAWAAGLLMQMDEREPGRGYRAEALEVCERAKARALLDTLVLGPAARNDARLAAAGQAVNLWSYRLSQAAAGEAADRLRARLNAALVEYKEVEAAVLAGSGAAHGPAPEPLSAARMQQEMVASGAVLIEYLLDDAGGWAWMVAGGGEIRVHKLPARRTVEALARRAVLWASQAPQSAAAVEGDGAQALEELARRVVWPLLPDGKVARRRVVICADGPLHGVPFGAMPMPGGREFVADAFEIVMAPSATVASAWGERRRQRRPAEGAGRARLAIVADPVFDAADARLGERSVRGATGRFPRLGFARAEAAAIGAGFAGGQTAVWLDFDASRQRFQSGALNGYRLLHVATHAVSDDAAPELSALVLSLRDRSGAAQDGFLRVHEIARLGLSADVITLSACRTGLGKAVEGEGPLSLGSAFLEAGAGAVLVSTWRVDDEATAGLMRAYYRDLAAPAARQLEPASSLRRAQQQIRRDARWAHPYYWAGWALIGSWK